MKFYYLGGISPHYRVDRLKAEEATELFASEEGQGRMFAYENNDYKVVSTSIVLAAIANSDSLNLKPYLMSEFVNFFLGYNPVTELQENIAQLIIGNSFPNPFSDQTSISYTVNKTSKVNIAIYDLKGQLIKQWNEEIKYPGNYRVIWDATNHQGDLVNNGYYFCKITSGDFTATKKLIVLH